MRGLQIVSDAIAKPPIASVEGSHILSDRILYLGASLQWVEIAHQTESIGSNV
jgi:hypothetical protein